MVGVVGNGKAIAFPETPVEENGKLLLLSLVERSPTSITKTKPKAMKDSFLSLTTDCNEERHP
jgi:hypothetical protein